jgi:hypothetical protein
LATAVLGYYAPYVGNLLRATSVNMTYSFKIVVSADEKGEGEPVQFTGPRNPNMLHIFLSFSVVSLFVDCKN